MSSRRFLKGLFFVGQVVALLVASLNVHAAPPAGGDDSNPGPITQPVAPAIGPQAPRPIPPVVTDVYFTPQDENTSTTVIFLYNTTAVAATVPIKTYYTNGALTIDTSVVVPANGLVRICSDTVSTVSASWAGAILINFTTFSAYGKISLPAGVNVEGYVAWNGTGGTYDPLVPTYVLPLNFTTGDRRKI
jgi:hypothetical protein